MRIPFVRTFVRPVALILFFLTALTPALASVARSLTLEELAERSTNVVVGHCAGLESMWSADGTRIVTVARFELAEDIKGGLVGQIEVEALGGEVGETGMYVPGTPTFEIGADEVLFVAGREDGRFEVVGMAQGQFRIAFTGPSMAPVVERRLEGLELLGSSDPRLRRGSLSDFVQAVREVVK